MLFTSANGVSERVSENGSTIMSQRLREDLRPLFDRANITSSHSPWKQKCSLSHGKCTVVLWATSASVRWLKIVWMLSLRPRV